MTTPSRSLPDYLIQNRALLLRYARARLGREDLAEDVLHDLWVRLSDREAPCVEEPLPYLYRALANAITDHKRSALRETRVISQDADPDACAQDEQPNAERLVIARSRQMWIEKVIADLPTGAATALSQSRIDGLTHRAIAQGMGMTVSGVEKHLQRAYKALALARLEEEEQARSSTREPRS